MGQLVGGLRRAGGLAAADRGGRARQRTAPARDVCRALLRRSPLGCDGGAAWALKPLGFGGMAGLRIASTVVCGSSFYLENTCSNNLQFPALKDQQHLPEVQVGLHISL